MTDRELRELCHRLFDAIERHDVEAVAELYAPAFEHSESPEARVRMARIRNLLAEHEYIVGRFYNRRKSFTAAKGRFEVIVSAYPDYTKFDRVLFELGGVQRKLGNDKDAEASWARLVKEFPNSQYARKIPASGAPKAVATSAALTK